VQRQALRHLCRGGGGAGGGGAGGVGAGGGGGGSFFIHSQRFAAPVGTFCMMTFSSTLARACEPKQQLLLPPVSSSSSSLQQFSSSLHSSAKSSIPPILQVSLWSSQTTKSQFFANNTRLFVHTESLLRSGGGGGVGVLGGVRVWPPHASSPPPSLGTRLFSIWRPNGDEGQHLLTARTRMMPILFGFFWGNLFLDPTPRTTLKPLDP
jgi:hypothetical protein